MAIAEQSDKPKFAPVPEWVKSIPIPEFTQANLTSHVNGEAWLLSDVQTIARPGGNTTFIHFATKVIDRIGLENGSNLTLSHDPKRQSLILNKILVWRAGVTINHEIDARIDTYRKEANISNGTLNGYAQTSLLIPDVRVGDIVEVAYTIDTIEAVFGLPYDTNFQLAFNTPVEVLYRRFLWPESNPLDYRTFNSSVAPVITKNGANLEYVWNLQKPAPQKLEASREPGKQQGSEVAVSSATSWKQIVDLMKPYYATTRPLPVALVERLDSISKKFPNKTDQLTEALRIVQDEIRYVSLSIGPGAFIPRSPMEVYSSGYGDCKDKALLLATMLGHLGIAAQPALTDLDQGMGIQAQPPSIGAFDHAIVRVELVGLTMWLDATDFSQGGRGFGISQAQYGYALPIREGAASLEMLPNAHTDSPTQITVETFGFPLTPEGDLSVDVETTYTSQAADQYRKNLANEGRESYTDLYFKYYLKRIPSLELGTALVINDDRDRNVIKVRENYRVPKFDYKNSAIGKEFPVTGLLGLNKLPEVPEGERKTPLYIGSSFNFRHVTIARNLNSTFPAPDAPQDIAPWFTFTSHAENDNGTFTLTWNLRSAGGVVQPKELAKFKTAVSQISEATDRLYNFAFQDEPNLESFPPKNSKATLGLFLVVSIVIAVIINWKTPTQRYAGNPFQPVSVGKFFIMSILTGTLYIYVWAWDGFKLQKHLSKSFSFPLLQAIIHPLLAFNILNSVVVGRLASFNWQKRTLLVGGTTLCFAAGAWDLYNTFVAEAPTFTDKYQNFTYNMVLLLVQSIALLPVVSYLVETNREQISTDRSYQRFSANDKLAIMVFFPLLCANLVLIYLGV